MLLTLGVVVSSDLAEALIWPVSIPAVLWKTERVKLTRRAVKHIYLALMKDQMCDSTSRMMRYTSTRITVVWFASPKEAGNERCIAGRDAALSTSEAIRIPELTNSVIIARDLAQDRFRSEIVVNITVSRTSRVRCSFVFDVEPSSMCK